MPHFRHSRPKDGYCYLDFLELWLVQALMRGDAEAAGHYAREVAHWCFLMHPQLAPMPHNVVLGED